MTHLRQMEASILDGVDPAHGMLKRVLDAVRKRSLMRDDCAPRRLRGFTLLELLVVLALVGLVAAIAVPNLERLYGAVTRETERDHILDQFAGLGLRAMRQGRNFVVFGAGASGGSGLPDSAGTGATFTAEDSASTTTGVVSTSLVGFTPYAIEVPDGWEFRLEPPLRIRANGVCLGAALTLYYQGEAEPPIDVDPPWCRVETDA